MKKKLLINLIVLLFAASGCAHTSESAKTAAKPDAAPASTVAVGSPALEVPESYFNFGEVKEGTDYTHAFVIKNNGTGVLEIRKVQPG